MYAVLLVFVVAGLLRFHAAPGEDLSSSYVGCRLIATGNTGMLYTFDPDNFASIGARAGAWERMKQEGSFHGYLHPYVQTPLWGYVLQPLCKHTKFRAFADWFLLLMLGSLAAAVWLVARYWTPWIYGPVGVGLVLLCLWCSQPFGYAMYLMQTHALFLLLIIAALILTERGRPLSGGFLMALAAVVKVTPGVLLIYWLLTRRWKAAASLVTWCCVLTGVTWLVAGSTLMHAYFADLHRVSRVLLVSLNNQSLAAWWMARFYAPDEVFDLTIHRLPTGVRIVSMLLMLGCAALGGLLDRWRASRPQAGEREHAPLGSMIALVGLTVFAPIAWTHYMIVLVAPVMLLAEQSHRRRSGWMAALVVAIVALNIPPLTTNVITMDVGDLSIVRGQFYAGLLCLVGLGAAGWMSRAEGRSGIRSPSGP